MGGEDGAVKEQGLKVPLEFSGEYYSDHLGFVGKHKRNDRPQNQDL